MEQETKYDVFISSKSEDYCLAEEIYDFLSKHGLSSFLASEELRKKGEAQYALVIDKALDATTHMIVVASSLKHINSKWVQYEWSVFSNDLKSGYRQGNLLTILSDEIELKALPASLRHQQSFSIKNYKKYLLDYLKVEKNENSSKIESEIAELESQKTEYVKNVLQKEQDLKLAQEELKACEEQIKKLHNKLLEINNLNKKAISVREVNNHEEKPVLDNKHEGGRGGAIVFPNHERNNVISEDGIGLVANSAIREFNVGGISFKMIFVEGKGSPFYIGETLVTQELWEYVMKNNPSKFKGKNHPVECVSWYDCQDFIKKLNASTNKTFRLPKESEWEYVSKGGNRSRGYVYAGSNNINDVAWYDKNAYFCGSKNPDYGTHDVKTKQPNELGVYDMNGNVWEWCDDMYGSNEARRVIMGGSWYDNASSCRVDSRSIIFPDKGFNLIGFRLALDCK